MNKFSEKYEAWKGSNSDSRKIFIIGTGRSGTHWVANILKGHPDIQITIEKPEIFLPVTRMALDFGNKQKLLPELIARYRWEHSQVAPQHYADKSHPNIWWAEKLAEAFPNSLFVGTNRNPYATVASMLKKTGVLAWHQRWKEFPIPNPFLGITQRNMKDYEKMSLAAKCALRWRSHQERMEYLRSALGARLYVVCYEKLILDPEERVRHLGEFLQLKSPLPMPKVKKESLERYKSELSPEMMDEIASVVGDLIYNSKEDKEIL